MSDDAKICHLSDLELGALCPSITSNTKDVHAYVEYMFY